MPAYSLLLLLWILVLLHILVTWWSAIRRGRLARQTDVQQPPPLPGNLPPVSVIVPAWNERGTIERNIAALRKVDYPCWEALIVAGGDDGTHATAIQAIGDDDRFRILKRGPEPKNAALNQGIQAARHDILVLLDADNIVEPGWLSALIAPIAGGASVSVGDSLANQETWITLEERMWHIHTYEILKMSWIQGDRSIAIRRDLLQRIGGLPTHTYAREDWDIWARLQETGERVAFAKGARLVTDRPATIKESWKHQVRWRRTHLSGMWEHRAALLKHPVDVFGQLYFYLLSIGLALLALVALMAIPLQPAWIPALANLLALVIVWLCARQAAIAGSVAAYTRDWRWASRAWMPALNLFLVVPASIVALLTPTSLNPYYKGPRNAEQLQ